MKHTPGPWKTLAGDWDKEFDGYCRYTIQPLKMLTMADANLISAAPEMYAALAELEFAWGHEWPEEFAQKVRAALAKAEGRND